MMDLFKTTLVLLTLTAAILSAGCSIPVCCASQPNVPPLHPETMKRMILIEQSLVFFSRRKFSLLTALYANETRSQFKAAIQKKGPSLSDEDIKKYVNGIRKYYFSKEERIQHQQRWMLVYESGAEHGKYIVYTVVKEDGEYRIVELKVAMRP